MAKILVIEPDYNKLMEYSKHLGNRGQHKLYIVPTDREAFFCFQKNQDIDLVISKQSPGEDFCSTKFLKRIRKIMRPLIVLTDDERVYYVEGSVTGIEKCNLLKNIAENSPYRNPEGKNVIDKYLEQNGIMPARPLPSVKEVYLGLSR